MVKDHFIQQLEDFDENALKGLKKSCEAGNSQALRLYYQLASKLVEKKVSEKDEFTASDYTQIARETVDGLRKELKGGGRCPVCGEYKALRDTALLDTEPELGKDREVAAVAVSARPD